MSVPTPGARRATTRPRRTPLIAAGALTCALVGGLAFTTLTDNDANNPTPAAVLDADLDGTPDTSDITVDLNGDGTPDDTVTVTKPDGTTEDVPLATAATERDVITTVIAPHAPNGPGPAVRDAAASDTTQTMLTPASDAWWTTLTSFGPDLHLWDAPTPTKATWYALTGSRATAKTLNGASTYSAIHVGFKDETDAQAYFDSIANNAAVIQWVRPLVRGTVLTFSSTWVDVAAEPFPAAKGKNAEVLAALKPKVATWTINYGRLHDTIAKDAYSAEAQESVRTIYKALGYTPTTQWNGIATNPDGPWVGKITDYDADQINFLDAAGAVGRTIKRECVNKDTCYETDLGLLDVSNGYVYATEDNAGFGRNFAYLPNDAPTDHLVRFGIDEGYVIGLINDTHSLPSAPIRLIRGWITDDLTQTLYTRVGGFPEETIHNPVSPTG